MKSDAASNGLSPSHRRRLVTMLALVGLGILSALDHGGILGHHLSDRDRFHSAEGTVAQALGGDMIGVDIPTGSGAVTLIRLSGVQCPEIAHPEGGSNSDFGTQAAEFIRQRVVGQRVRLELDPLRASRDQSGRLLAYVYLIDSGEMLNELLIGRGMACADGRFQHIYQERFIRLEKEAVQRKVGLWAAIKPADCRRGGDG